jgi:acyl-CoA synthetase (AMP-forming)/AMP-acid ligase II/acyl carrier protein
MVREPKSLGEALRLQASVQPHAPAVTFLNDGAGVEPTWTYGELDRRARAIAVSLAGAGVAKGDRALILHPPGLDLIAAFFGCQYAGVVPAMTYPETARPGSRAYQRLRRLLLDAQCRIHLRSSDDKRQALGDATPELLTDRVDIDAAASFREVAVGSQDTAFLQYTSGSTREPRGVMVTQENILANIRHISLITRSHSGEARSVTWVPPYHDLGLVGGICTPIATGFPAYLMDPRRFLQRPMIWIEALSRYRATASAGPDSAYAACARSARDEDLKSLDLSNWTVAFNGAETVRPETLRLFSERFAPCGFRPETFYPCYGLAESTLIVTGGSPGSHWREIEVQEGGRLAVSMGQPILGHEVQIVSPETGRLCGDGERGEIWVRGPSVARGYWNRREETEATFRAQLMGSSGEPYLRTGDLGCFIDGELLVAGRLKDLILLHGRNLFPQDIEDTMEACHPAIEPRGCAAFSVDTGSEEALIVLAEIRRTERRHLDSSDAIDAIRRAISREHGVAAQDVVLLPPQSLPRTTSGKIQRTEARRLFQTGAFKPLFAFSRRLAAKSASLPYVGSMTTVEELRLKAAALLRMTPVAVPIDVNLLELGLDSLMRVELLLALPATLRDALPASALEGTMTLQELAEFCYRSKPRDASQRPPTPTAAVPLSPRQREFLERPGVTMRERFGIQIRMRTPAGLDIEAMRAALASLPDVHEALRLRFRLQNGAWLQFVDGGASGDVLEVVDVSQVLPGQGRAQSASLDEKLIGGIDLDRGPLHRGLLLDRGPAESGLLSLFFHHLVTDAVSVAIILADLSQNYSARVQGTEPNIEPMGASFVAWCHANASEWASSPGTPVSNASEPSLPDPAPRQERSAPIEDGAQVRGGLDPETDALLRERFKTSRDFEALMLAAFASACVRTHASPLRVGIQAHGRWARHGIDPAFCVGWFASLHTLELPLIENSTDLSLLEQSRAALRSVHEGGGIASLGGRPRIRMEYRSIIEDAFRERALFPVLDVVWRNPSHSAAAPRADLVLTCGHRRLRLWWSLSSDTKTGSEISLQSCSDDIRSYLETAARWLFES